MKRILVALDGSPREGGVLSAALGLARRIDAKIVLFRAVGLPHDLPREVTTMSPNEIGPLLERRAARALESLQETVPEHLRAGIRVHIGSPWDAICRAAVEVDADAIVIGSHGYDALDRLTGTTAAKVVNHADRTVIVVRAPERLA
jgi:nucleotide-binding universal stress UspA family protein